MTDLKRHWERVYEKRRPDEVTWFQPRPETSLALVDAAGLGPDARVIDVGGGASRLVDHLLDRGFRDVTVLDLSARALAASQERLGDRAGRARWLEGDALKADLGGPFDLWHDRAVCHFLIDEADRDAYRQALERNLAPGGYAIVATFAEDGPERCSGLPVQRYSPESLARTLGPGMRTVDCRREEHVAPDGRVQAFVYCLLRRAA